MANLYDKKMIANGGPIESQPDLELDELIKDIMEKSPEPLHSHTDFPDSSLFNEIVLNGVGSAEKNSTDENEIIESNDETNAKSRGGSKKGKGKGKSSRKSLNFSPVASSTQK